MNRKTNLPILCRAKRIQSFLHTIQVVKLSPKILSTIKKMGKRESRKFIGIEQRLYKIKFDDSAIENFDRTMDKRQVFSRSAPTQPVNPMINVIVPQHIRMKAGSRAI